MPSFAGADSGLPLSRTYANQRRLDGPGVAPEHRAEIFKPYFTTQPKGTGLGLAVVQQIVRAHGWEIECVPNDSKGAIFRITRMKVTSKNPEHGS